MTDKRNPDGTFADGNPGGPGRPPRATERAYLAAMSDAVTLEDWRQIVARAVTDAKAGDKGARDWLAKYLLGDTPMTLTELATREAAGVTPGDEIAALVADQSQPEILKFGNRSLLEMVRDMRDAYAERKAAEQAEREAEAKREARRIARAARQSAEA